MRSLLYAILPLVVTSAALAGAFNDFASGIEANNRGEPGLAEYHFTNALSGNELAPAYRPASHLGRARAFLHERRCIEAEADLSRAIALKPDYMDAYTLRAETNQCLGRGEAALADINTALHLKPAAGPYYTRSRLYWTQGHFQAAYRDAMTAVEDDPNNSYFGLWAAVTGLRIGQPFTAQLAELPANNDWPGPVIQLFLGSGSVESVMRAAAGNSEKLCEADFYTGQWKLFAGHREEARRHFVRAENECPRDFVAFEAASAELKRLP